MGKCEAKEQCASKTVDHPQDDLTNPGENMIQNAPISDMAVDSPNTKPTKSSKDMKSTSVNVKPTTPSVKPTSLQENLASNPNSFLAAIGDSEEYVKPIVKDGEIILEVECGQNKAYLYLSKLCQGSKGPCIFFQTSWLTPNEFQFVSGRETAKDWKRSIRHHGKSLKLLLTKGILSVHPTVCDCEGCRHGSSTPTRCRTGEKRKAPSSEGKKVKKPQGAVEHHANGAFKPVDRSRPIEAAKPGLAVDGKIPQDQNLPSFSGKKSIDKHCSPLKESKSANVIDAANLQQRQDENEPPALKKAKVQGQDEVNCEVKVKAPEQQDPGNEPPVSIPVHVDLPATVKPKETIKIDVKPKCPLVESVVMPAVNLLPEPVPDVKDEVKVHVKPIVTCPEASLPEASCSDVNVTETVCVTEHADVALKSEPEKAEAVVRSDSPVIEEAKSVVNTSVDVRAASPCLSSCPSSPEPEGDSEVCQRILPLGLKYLKAHSAKAAERQSEARANVSIAPETEHCKESPKVKVHVTPETKSKAADDTSPKCVRRETEKVSPRLIPDPRTASEVPQLRQPETGDAAFSDYMRLLAAGHGTQMLHQHQHQPSIESLYNMRPPEVAVNPTMLHPLQACSMYSHPGIVQKEPVSYPTTAGALPTQIGAPCFAPLHLMPARVPYAMHQQPMVDMSRSFQYYPLPGSVPYHCGPMGAMKRCSSEIDSASALDLSTSKRLRLEYSTPEYRIDSLSGYHGFQPYGYDYSRHFSEELSRKMHVEEGFNATGSLDFASYTPSWIDHAGKAVFHRCTCAESRPGDIRFWSVEDVCRFISMLDGCSVYAEYFREQRVDGRILPLLTTDHLMKNLGMKLGPAVLVAEAVAKKVQEASKYPGCDSCRKLILGVS